MWRSGSEEAVGEELITGGDRTEREKTSFSKLATLGPSLVIQGTLSGEEDLMIEGRVEGEIALRQHSVTIGPKGKVQADVFSKSITVEGEVAGNLFGEDQVTIRRSGKVRGNVTSPRVSLEDGSRFKGEIDMKAPPNPTSEESSPPTPSGSRVNRGQLKQTQGSNSAGGSSEKLAKAGV